MKNKKIGHQAPKGCRINDFNSIEIEGDLAYCESHNFVYNVDEEKDKLYNGLPCYYTDIRFKDGRNNFYKNCKLLWTRRRDISLKKCIRKVLKCKNIPLNTTVDFNKSWYYKTKEVDNSYKFIIKKENKLDVKYQINNPKYTSNFTNCDFSQNLTNALRENGFIVIVERNESLLGNLFNAAVAITGQGDLEDTEIEGDIAIAYGHGKKIGFSSFKNDFQGYSNGCENILWDIRGEFDKWSRCREISKDTSIDEIVEILKQENTEIEN